MRRFWEDYGFPMFLATLIAVLSLLMTLGILPLNAAN